VSWRPRRRHRSVPGFWTPGLTIIVVIAVVLAGAAVLVVAIAVVPGARAYTYLNGTLEIGGVRAFETPGYFSLNVASPDLAEAGVETLVAATGVTYMNSGYAAEDVNQSAGIDYFGNGTSGPYHGENDSEFIGFCEAIRCHATLAVPGEIDDPGAAAVTVRYVEQTLGFHPTYWEIGNEPVSWTHFGIPWARWTSNDDSTPTPLEYARMVQQYVIAIRSVDPAAQIIGLQSDTGAPADSDWFTTLMQIDGPNLSAVAYHSYAGGRGTPGESLAGFFGSLSKPGAFPLSYPATVDVVRAACESCDTRVLVGEYNSALLGNLTGYATSYPEAPYVAAGLLEGLEENASQVTFYALQPSGNAGLLDSDNAPLPVYDDYSTFFPNVTLPWIDNATVVGGPAGVFALVSHNGTRASLLIVNTDTTDGLRLGFSNASAFAGPVEQYLDGPRQSGPSVSTEPMNATSSILIPPEGILLVDGDLPAVLLGELLGGPASVGSVPAQE
jgi:hypothetical protein